MTIFAGLWENRITFVKGMKCLRKVWSEGWKYIKLQLHMEVGNIAIRARRGITEALAVKKDQVTRLITVLHV